jgi:hypothetical protein
VADIFISYKRDERPAVERLAREFERLGLKVWFDAGLNAGEAFSDEIDREAHAAKAILVCWSPTAKDSQWVKAEALIGFEHGKLAACYVTGPDGFYPPTPFNAIHAEDLRTWLAAPSHAHSGWKGVLRRIGKLSGRADIESYGALDAYASATTLRAWLDQYSASPLFVAVEESLQARSAEEAELARLEHAARERRAQQEAAWRADQENLPVVSSNEFGELYETKRRQLETQREAEVAQELEELRWALGAAHAVDKLTRDLRVLFPRWEVEFRPLNKDADFDFAMLLNAAPPNPTPEQVKTALESNQWHHDFVEAGVFIEESRITLTCGEFGAEAYFRKPSTYHFRTDQLEWKRYVRCDLFDETTNEIANFDALSFDRFVASSGGAELYSERLKLLHAWIRERFAEFCAIRDISPDQYEIDSEADRQRAAASAALEGHRPPQTSHSTAGGVLNYLKETALALLLLFAIVIAFSLVANWIEMR